jgi:hypothetical protein
MYLPPTLATGTLKVTAADVEPWLGHIKTIYPDDADHIVKWLAHRTQHPGIKINHCLLLGGAPGIGKDTILEPVKYAIGPWNFQEVGPQDIFSTYSGYMRSVILRISEGRDLGDVNRFALYEHLKTVIATPPDTKRVNEKYLREYYLFNVTAVVITSNYKVGGVYLAPDDRRTYVAWSNSVENDFNANYWNKLWGWYYANQEEGIRKVAAFLRAYDLSSFDPKATPPRTPAFFEIVASGVAQEEIELADVIDSLQNPDPKNPDPKNPTMIAPDTLTIEQLIAAAPYALAEWLRDRNNRKAIPHRLEKCGYVRTPNPNNPRQGIWIVKLWETHSGRTPEQISRRMQVYAKASLSYNERVKAVRAMIAEIGKKTEADARMAANDPKAWWAQEQF